jgi:hypothetical protein
LPLLSLLPLLVISNNDNSNFVKAAEDDSSAVFLLCAYQMAGLKLCHAKLID